MYRAVSSVAVFYCFSRKLGNFKFCKKKSKHGAFLVLKKKKKEISVLR